MDEQHERSVTKGSPSAVARLADFATRSLADLETSSRGRRINGRPLVVAADGSGDVRTLAEGVRLGGPGAKLLVKPGTYQEALALTVDIDIEGIGEPSAVTIAGPGDRPTVSVEDGRHSMGRLTISGGRQGDRDAGLTEVAAVQVAKGVLHLEGVTFTDCSGPCLRAGSKYASVEVRDCIFRADHGNVIEFSDAAGGRIEGCTVECGVQLADDPEPLIHISGDQTDPILQANTLREGGILVTDNATPRIEANTLEQRYSGFAMRISNAAPWILANHFELTSASGVRVQGLSRRGGPVIEDNHVRGNNRRTGFSVEGQARLVRNHISGFTLGVGLESRGSEVALIDNTIEACDLGIELWLRAEAYPRAGILTGPDASISGMTFVDTEEEFQLRMSEVTAVGPITLGDPSRLNPLPATSHRYGRDAFTASEVRAWDEVQKLVDDFNRPNPSRQVIATCDGLAFGRALALVASAAGDEHFPYVVLAVADRTCELIAFDNYRIAAEVVPVHAGEPGRYPIDLSACRVAAAKLGDPEGPVTLFQDDEVITISWGHQIVIAKRQEPDLPDYERVMRPSPTDWTKIDVSDLRDTLAEARVEQASGALWIEGSPVSGVTLLWKVDGGGARGRKVAGGQVPSAFRAGLSLRYVAEMVDSWLAGDLLLGVIGPGKPVHFRATDHPGLRYAIMPLRAEFPDEFLDI